jgi:flagellar assembly factor FliW
MKITTQQFGEINFEDEHIVKFSSGLFGFEKLTKYLLIKTNEDLFYWLNSVEEPDISFPLIGTRVINTSFPEEDNHEAFGIVTLNQDPLKVTVNLKAPVYIDQNKKTGFQSIIDDEKFPVDYHLFVEN